MRTVLAMMASAALFLGCPYPDKGDDDDETDGDGPCGAMGCGDACDLAGERIVARYEACGIEVEEDPGEEYECDEETAASAECLADVIEAADCSYLDGSADPTDEAYLEWASSVSDCV